MGRIKDRLSGSVDAARWRLLRRIHISWLIALLCASITIGVVLVPYLGVSFSDISWLVVAALLAALSFWKRNISIVPLLVVAGLLLGLWRGGIDFVQLAPYTRLVGYEVTLVGTVSDDPDTGKKNETILRLSNPRINGHQMSGTLWVTTHENRDLKRGDSVTITGKIAEGFGNFAASMYRADIVKVERPVPGDVARQVRDGFADHVRQAVPEPEASLGIGYLVGQRRALPPELDEALVIAGLTHIVVASGYNLTILVRLARRLFVKLSRYTALAASAGLVGGFIAVTGASPSMSRAGLIAGLSLLAWYYGRKFHPLVLLTFAAAITLLVNPSYGWGDVGWQLSFAAFAGVMIIAPLLQAYFFGDKKPGTIRQILGETVAAQICTLPILVLVFGQFSNVALIANMLVLPLVPLAMLLTFIAGIGAMVAPGAAEIIGAPASVLLGYMVGVAEYLAGQPWAQTTLEISPLIAWMSYGAVICLALYAWRKTKYNLRDTNLVE